MNLPLNICVPERGHSDIDKKTFAALSGHADFWRLSEQKIISVTQLSPHKVRLIGSCFVGRVLLDDFVLEIDEKVEGSLAALQAGEEYKANPDLVLSRSQGVQAIGDVKYKEWTGSPAGPDLYQLLVHASTYHAPLAFLVYPHDDFAVRDLGVSKTGPRTWLFAIDVRRLEEHLLRALTEMGLQPNK